MANIGCASYYARYVHVLAVLINYKMLHFYHSLCTIFCSFEFSALLKQSAPDTFTRLHALGVYYKCKLLIALDKYE